MPDCDSAQHQHVHRPHQQEYKELIIVSYEASLPLKPPTTLFDIAVDQIKERVLGKTMSVFLSSEEGQSMLNFLH